VAPIRDRRLERRPYIRAFPLAFAAATTLLAACGAPQSRSAPAGETATIPPGKAGAFITRGKNLVDETHRLLPAYVGAHLACSSCHIDAGRHPGPLSFVWIFGHYPQFSDRTKRFIGLRDRIAECFFFSMNGEPPSYFGPDIIAIEAYIALLSRGSLVGPAPPVTFSYRAPKSTSKKAGAAIYSTQCAACHGSNGAGNEAAKFPPLWGSTSFNDRAGMDRIMPAFVKKNMPLDHPGTLTDQQAADVSAYVLAQPRPRFDPSRLKNISPQEAKFFR
jgi:thiosulfate dehydrogenase